MPDDEPMSDATNHSDLIEPHGFRRADLVRLMTQCLTTLGYSQAASTLQQESGIQLLSEPISRFRDAVVKGEWDVADGLLEQLGFEAASTKLTARFFVQRQKYLEHLEARRPEEALKCLRGQLAPLELKRSAAADAAAGGAASAAAAPASGAGSLAAAVAPPVAPMAAAAAAPAGSHSPFSVSPPPVGGTSGASSHARPNTPPPTLARLGSTVRELSAYLMCDPSELSGRTGWDGASGESRSQLLGELQRLIPPSLLLPDDRLQTLLHQAVLWQSAQCVERPSHASTGHALLLDFAFSRDEIPRTTHLVLERHHDEVWYAAFSHAGGSLASASKDGLIMLWPELHEHTFQQAHPSQPQPAAARGVGAAAAAAAPTSMSHGRVLSGHTYSLCAIVWSPDDQHLLSCGNDQVHAARLVPSSPRPSSPHRLALALALPPLPDDPTLGHRERRVHPHLYTPYGVGHNGRLDAVRTRLRLGLGRQGHPVVGGGRGGAARMARHARAGPRRERVWHEASLHVRASHPHLRHSRQRRRGGCRRRRQWRSRWWWS